MEQALLPSFMLFLIDCLCSSTGHICNLSFPSTIIRLIYLIMEAIVALRYLATIRDNFAFNCTIFCILSVVAGQLFPTLRILPDSLWTFPSLSMLVCSVFIVFISFYGTGLFNLLCFPLYIHIWPFSNLHLSVKSR